MKAYRIVSLTWDIPTLYTAAETRGKALFAAIKAAREANYPATVSSFAVLRESDFDSISKHLKDKFVEKSIATAYLYAGSEKLDEVL